MTKGVMYFNKGHEYLERLLVSLDSLRQNWDGPVVVINEGKRYHVLERICSKYQVEQLSTFLTGLPGYAAKVAAMLVSPFERTMFLDEDTLVMAEIEPFFDYLENHDLVFTKFPGWTTARKRVWGPLTEWFGLGLVPDKELQRAMSYPGINTGVVGFKRSRSLEEWFRVTSEAEEMGLPVTDESSAQALLGRLPHKLVNCGWNQSPVYGQSSVKGRILHFHGRSHESNQSRPRYVKLWRDAADLVMTKNSDLFASTEEEAVVRSEVGSLQSMIVVSALDAAECGHYRTMAKVLIASFLRCGFQGEIVVLRNSNQPLFSIRRKNVKEIHINERLLGRHNRKSWVEKLMFNKRLIDLSESMPIRAVVFVDADCLCINGIEDFEVPEGVIMGGNGSCPVWGISVKDWRKIGDANENEIKRQDVWSDPKRWGLKSMEWPTGYWESIGKMWKREKQSLIKPCSKIIHFNECENGRLEWKVREQFGCYAKSFFGDASNIMMDILEP